MLSQLYATLNFAVYSKTLRGIQEQLRDVNCDLRAQSMNTTSEKDDILHHPFIMTFHDMDPDRPELRLAQIELIKTMGLSDRLMESLIDVLSIGHWEPGWSIQATFYPFEAYATLHTVKIWNLSDLPRPICTIYTPCHGHPAQWSDLESDHFALTRHLEILKTHGVQNVHIHWDDAYMGTRYLYLVHPGSQHTPWDRIHRMNSPRLSLVSTWGNR